MALHVTCRLRMTSMTTGERGDAETVTPRSEGGGRKRASNGTSSAPYPTLGHPFLENNEFRERMSQVASTG